MAVNSDGHARDTLIQNADDSNSSTKSAVTLQPLGNVDEFCYLTLYFYYNIIMSWNFKTLNYHISL